MKLYQAERNTILRCKLFIKQSFLTTKKNHQTTIGCYTFTREKTELHKPTLDWGETLYSFWVVFRRTWHLLSTLIYKYLIVICELFSHMQNCSLQCSNLIISTAEILLHSPIWNYFNKSTLSVVTSRDAKAKMNTINQCTLKTGSFFTSILSRKKVISYTTVFCYSDTR